VFRLGILVNLLFLLLGCATTPVSPEALKQQQEADLVVSWQSWNSVWLVKPDISGMVGSLPEHIKTFTSAGLEKLLRNLKTPRDFAVVILDRQYSPDPLSAKGGIDTIQQFFEEMGFQRVVFQDETALEREGARVILRDTASK
jgi:hypothetical protein